ncbi:MAG: chemotaxis protein CheB [Bradyrhizobium sp.]|nr:chemotaxis protein CheB [Bradyrhizobium sp.]
MSNRDIVVIGGSSGATDPLKEILSRLPADLPAAILAVLHIPSGGIGILSTVASAASKLPVRQAENGMPIQSGHVYVGAPDHHLLVFDGHIVLGRGPRENMARPAIDPLFRSAALHYGPRVIGVVLSGNLCDGAAGLNAIKRRGGVALVQDPADAIVNEMPSRALEATTVDLCVPGALLGDVLSDLVRERPGAALPVSPELALEVAIAAGEGIDKENLTNIADATALTCPGCGGVLSNIRGDRPLRFRCQAGHAYTADALARHEESRVDEALRVALRIIEERAELVHRMAEGGRQSGRAAVAQMYDARAAEYRRYADLIRRAVIDSLDPQRPKPRWRWSMTAVPPTSAERPAQIEAEKRMLAKAEADLENGRTRLRNQKALLTIVHDSERDAEQAERLAALLRQTLIEWERHRNLIERRIAYLEGRTQAG